MFPRSLVGTWRIIPGLGYVVNNDGDPFRPQDLGLWDLFQMAELHGFIWGDPALRYLG